MYKVLRTFADLQDNKYLYNVGDIYPREGLAVSAERFHELSGKNNAAGVALIEYVAEDATSPSESVSDDKGTAPAAKAKTAARKPRKRKES